MIIYKNKQNYVIYTNLEGIENWQPLNAYRRVTPFVCRMSFNMKIPLKF